MKTKISLKELLIALISIAPILYFLYLWRSLPEIIPIHFDLEGNPDGNGSKNIIGIGLLFFSLGIYFFLKYIPKIYKSNSFTMAEKTFDHLRLILAVFFSALIVIIIHSIHQSKVNNTLIYIAIALLISMLGNYMRNVRPNHSSGKQFRWTIKDESSWKQTQNFIGILWFFTGFILAILVFVLPENFKIYVFTLGIFISMLLLPIIYSIYIHKKNKSSETENPKNEQSSYSDHWVGLFYFNRNDKRILVPKRVVGMGWTLNFGNPYSFLLLIALIVIIIFLNQLS